MTRAGSRDPRLVKIASTAVVTKLLGGNKEDIINFTDVWRTSELFLGLREPESAGACSSCGSYDACGTYFIANSYTFLPFIFINRIFGSLPGK